MTVFTRPMRLAALAEITYTVDDVEHARRSQAAGGAVLSPDVLDLMLGLPLGEPIPVDTLTSRERAALRTAPGWAVHPSGGHALRLATPPVSVSLASVTARSWRDGLEKAGRFAPFCARRIVRDTVPRNAQQMCMEADFWGVGVTIKQGGHAEVLVEPEPYRQQRWTAAGWLFLERVYQQHLKAAVSTVEARPR